jgi:hypothetical protein
MTNTRTGQKTWLLGCLLLLSYARHRDRGRIRVQIYTCTDLIETIVSIEPDGHARAIHRPHFVFPSTFDASCRSKEPAQVGIA